MNRSREALANVSGGGTRSRVGRHSRPRTERTEDREIVAVSRRTSSGVRSLDTMPARTYNYP
jgi:hypothetical protein